MLLMFRYPLLLFEQLSFVKAGRMDILVLNCSIMMGDDMETSTLGPYQEDKLRALPKCFKEGLS